jgi:hypothetical protein
MDCEAVRVVAAGLILSFGVPLMAQVDQQRAAAYFKEAAALCARENGRIWGQSLCGPMVFTDPVTHTTATNQAPPDAKPPAMLGFANSAIDWGGTRWSTYVWQGIPTDEHARGRLMMHELFHRIQPDLGLFVREGRNEHLDTLHGRYWIELEWRALAGALAASGPARTTAIRDALAFRAARRKQFPAAAVNEGLLEINEGLAQYTGTVASSASPAEAVADAVNQLKQAESNPTFIRTFAYPSGAAYGILLDGFAPGWTRRIKATDDIGQLLLSAAKLQPADDLDAAAGRYGGPELMAAEEKRDAERAVRIAALRRRFVESPVLVLPGAGKFSFITTNMMPVPGAGTVYPAFRTTAEWGTMEAESALLSPDMSTVTVPAPVSPEGVELSGDGWKLKLAPGWRIKPGSRAGDFQVAK